MVVALHHDRALDLELADALVVLVGEAHLDALHWQADGADLR